MQTLGETTGKNWEWTGGCEIRSRIDPAKHAKLSGALNHLNVRTTHPAESKESANPFFIFYSRFISSTRC